MQDTFGLDLLSDLKEDTSRSNSYIDMVFGRNVDRLTCIKYVSYFSYHRPILCVTSQATQITEFVPEKKCNSWVYLHLQCLRRISSHNYNSYLNTLLIFG
jgi:hypothetical protein